MAPKQTRSSIRGSVDCRNSVMIYLSLAIVATQVLSVTCLYLPSSYTSKYQPAMRRQDMDEDDMDSGASAPYQNQDDGSNNGAGGDGYEDGSDADGPYGETSREEEGQADLERFFDDHLGASEKDGMDKENLPTNIVQHYLLNPQRSPSGPLKDSTQPEDQATFESRRMNYNEPQRNDPVDTPATSYLEQSQSMPKVQTSYIELPNNKLIITRQITRASDDDGQSGLTQIPSLPKVHHLRLFQPSTDTPDANESGVVTMEDDDMDRVYVTRNTKKPFKIDDLGGYDPEEDFQSASRDIDESSQPARNTKGNRRRGGDENAGSKDITFNDPETDILYGDASETDEITFGQDDPYQTDLEAEMRAQAYNLPGKSTLEPREPKEDASYEMRPSEHPTRRTDKEEDDDTEGKWVNDGADDMEIPAQSDQDRVLDKAAKQEELAREASEAGKEVQQPEQVKDDGESQRMPNADYMKEDMVDDDPDDSAL